MTIKKKILFELDLENRNIIKLLVIHSILMNFKYHPTMCSHAFIVTSEGCRCMIIGICESASHDKKPWPKSIFLHFFCFKWKKPRINNGVINNVFKDALFFQHLNMAGRHLLLYLFCFSFETSYSSFLDFFSFLSFFLAPFYF